MANLSIFAQTELLGITKAYSINEKMMTEEDKYDNWKDCEAAIVETISNYIPYNYGSIHAHVAEGAEILIEGAFPPQSSDTDRGDARGDMARFIVSKVALAVREQETAMLTATDPSHLNSDNQSINTEYYMMAVLKRCIDMAIKDSAIMSILNTDLELSGSKHNTYLYKLLQSLSRGFSLAGEGFGALDYFERLDAITAELDYEFWISIVNECFDAASDLLEREVLAFAAATCMGTTASHKGIDTIVINGSDETIANFMKVFAGMTGKTDK